MTRTATDWARLYYDSVEHLLWNPGWIGWTKADRDASRREDAQQVATVKLARKQTVMERITRLGRLEAPLHHNIHLFLTLAPASLVAKLVQMEGEEFSQFEVVHCAGWEKVVVGARKPVSLLELCQPDVFLDSSGVQIAIEIKAASKSSLEQVLKYSALLKAQGSERASRQKLVFWSTCSSFSELWLKKYPNVEALRAALNQVEDSDLDKKFGRYGVSLAEAKAHAARVEIDWRPLKEIRDEIVEERRRIGTGNSSAALEVYAKLHSGFERELGTWPKVK